MPDVKPTPTPVCRAVWALLEKGGRVTFDRITEITGKHAYVSRPYVDVLLRRGYVALVGIQTAVSGETVCMFELVNRTGRDAPYVDEYGAFVDPNLSNAGHARGILTARVRLAAERMGRFTRRELFAVANVPKGKDSKFHSIWAQLKAAGEVVQDPEVYSDATDSWLYVGNPQVTALREYFGTHTGEAIDSKKLKAAGMSGLYGSVIGQALDLLALEGFKIAVTRPQRSRNAVVYQVEPPEGMGEFLVKISSGYQKATITPLICWIY